MKDIYKVLEYIDDNGEEQSLNFDCSTPHVLISGDKIADILGLEKKMLKNLSESNGKDINLVVVDDKSVLPEDFFEDLDFNYVSRITEEEAINKLDGSPTYTFVERYMLILKNDEKNFTQFNESGKEHLKMLVYFFPSISENKKLHEVLGKSSTSIQVGVHFIAGINFIVENPLLLEGCETRFAFPSRDKVQDLRFFRRYLSDLPLSGELWFKFGLTGKIKPIKLK